MKTMYAAIKTVNQMNVPRVSLADQLVKASAEFVVIQKPGSLTGGNRAGRIKILLAVEIDTPKNYLTSIEASEVLGLASSAMSAARIKDDLVGVAPPEHEKSGQFFRYSVEVLKAWLEAFKEKHRS